MAVVWLFSPTGVDCDDATLDRTGYKVLLEHSEYEFLDTQRDEQVHEARVLTRSRIRRNQHRKICTALLIVL